MMGKLPHSSCYAQSLIVGIGFLVAVAGWPFKSEAYRHHDSNIKYHEYGQQTFDLARREQRPVFMVLSAVWCFWCKTYEQRTLEKPEVSAYLNKNFINIFVDIDQRQDLQHLYVTKGIPTTVIFTPRGAKFLTFSGTLGQTEFLSGLRQVLADMGAGSRPPQRESAPSVHDVLKYLPAARAASKGQTALAKFNIQRRSEFIELALDSFDEEQGGFGLGKKYPLGRVAQYLLENGAAAGGRDLASKSARVTLKHLDQVGKYLYDSVEGGFFRYSDSRTWNRPRHEKMLVTNINLLRAYQLAGQNATTEKARRDYKRLYGKSLAFFFKTYPQIKGGLAGSLDGKNPEYYRLSAAGRAKANPPSLDRTVYTAWNSEAAYLLSQIHSDDPSHRTLQVITGILDFIRTNLFTPSGGLYSFQRAKDGRAVGLGQLKDNSWGALAFIAGYELTGKAEYLRSFESIVAYLRKQLFLSDVGAYRLWNVPANSGFRDREHISEEVPMEENGILAFALTRAYIITNNKQYRLQAEALVRTLSRLDFREFEDDPSDEGKQFLLSFVYYLKALNQLAQLES